MVAVGALATAATMVAMMAPMANAEPIGPNGKFVKPAAYDIVGVGSESLTAVMDQLTFNYNKTVPVKKHSPSDPYNLSWDAVPPKNLNNTTQQIVVKAGCKSNTRPNGSGAGITALQTHAFGNTSYTFKGKKHTVACIDFARSSRPRGPSDLPYAKGGVAFVFLAQDAVTYATAKTTNVPNFLNKAQLFEIFGCTIPAAHGFPAGTWGALLGSGAKNPTQSPDPILPQAGSGTLSFWAKTVLGLSSTSEPSCGSAAGLPTKNQPEENEGTNALFKTNSANILFPFSIGVYVAQKYHSHACGKPAKKGQNLYGCAQNGILLLDGVNFNGHKIVPTVPVARGSKIQMTNPALNTTIYKRFLFNVVEYSTASKDHIPGYLEKWFGVKGFFCKQVAAMNAYGFEKTGACGRTI